MNQQVANTIWRLIAKEICTRFQNPETGTPTRQHTSGEDKPAEKGLENAGRSFPTCG
ncbi:MAG: hypothetical protein ACOZF0_05520 [Thermodesulfobacteriota bacterium]